MLGLSHRMRLRLDDLSIYQRIAIGNGFVIAIGAIAGTLLTSHLADRNIDLWLILLFSILGTALAVLMNAWIVKHALRPIRELSELVQNPNSGFKEMDTGGLIYSDPEIKRLAASLRTLVNQLESQNRRLRALTSHAINAQEDERKRIARGLHDDTGQAISMLMFNLQRLEDKLAEESVEIGAHLDILSATRELASRTLDGLREIIYGLRPTILDDLGLLPAIRWYARLVLEPIGVKISYRVPDENIQLSSTLTTTLFRITQEAINNIERHACAQNVTIELVRRRGRVFLQVEDDGRGFDVDSSSTSALRLKQLGLLGIRERVDLVGGELHVVSSPGRGTRLEVCIRVSPEREGVTGEKD